MAERDLTARIEQLERRLSDLEELVFELAGGEKPPEVSFREAQEDWIRRARQRAERRRDS